MDIDDVLECDDEIDLNTIIENGPRFMGVANPNWDDTIWDHRVDTFTWDELDDLEDYMGMILATAQDAEDYDDVDQLKKCLSEIASYAETALNVWNSET